MLRLGELERAVMNVLWAAPEPMPAKAIGDAVGADHAVETEALRKALENLG